MAISAENLPHEFSPTKTFSFQFGKSESMPWKTKLLLLETKILSLKQPFQQNTTQSGNGGKY